MLKIVYTLLSHQFAFCRCQCILNGADTLQKLRSSRRQVKVLGKEAVDGFAALVRKSMAIVVWYICQSEARIL